MKDFVLKGNIYYSISKDRIEMLEDAYVVCIDGESKGVFKVLPACYQHLKVRDYTGQTILPGLVDLHVHAPQYAFRGIGMEMELIEWLETNVFPEEAKFDQIDYSGKAYGYFVTDLVKSATTRACIFATRHTPATVELMKQLEQTGLVTYVGKVNMDRHAPDYLVEGSAAESIEQTIQWLHQVHRMTRTKPILTPRFIPSCTDTLMQQLGLLQQKYQLPVQSHLSENLSEIEWVKELCPMSKFYGDAYDQFGLFGKTHPVVMAHCVHSSDEEIERMRENKVFVAHCPESNTNLLSGIAPIRKYLDAGLNVGLGSDIAAGTSLSLFKCMVDAIQVSKLRWRLVDASYKPLSIEEVFYLATKGGGAFFGQVGSFEAGYAFDAIVIDDEQIPHPQPLDMAQRLERVLYLATDEQMTAKFVEGVQIALS